MAVVCAALIVSKGSYAQVVGNKNDRLVDSISVYYPITPVLIGKDDNPVLQVRVDVLDSITPRVLNRLSVSTLGTSNLDDLRAVRVFRAPDAGALTTIEQFGKTQKAGEVITFDGNMPLIKGPNYFWVAVQLNSNASLSNKVQITIGSVTVNGEKGIPRQVNSSIPKRIGHALRKHGDEGVDTYRIPGLVTTNNGTLIAVYDVRRNSAVDLQGDIDVGMSRSTDGGHTWGPMKIIMDMGKWGGKGQFENGIGDPSILIDKQTNTIWVAGVWAHGHSGKRNWFASQPGLKPVETSQFILVKSEDDGLTWSGPINITKQVKDPRWYLLLQGPGKGISLSNGTLVFPAQFKDANQVPHATVIYSTDHGMNWRIGNGVRKETTEAQVVVLADGRIMINARNNEARGRMGIGRVVATTGDMGKTWQKHPSSIVALEESTCMASLILEEFGNNGKLLLFSNPNTHTGRFNMTIKASRDEGNSWPEENRLLLDEGESRGYSCLTRIDDETVGILYEGSQADIVFERVRIDEILGGQRLSTGKD